MYELSWYRYFIVPSRAREKKREQIRHQDLTELHKLIDKLDEAILLEKQSYY